MPDEQLPVLSILPELKRALVENVRVILEAPPGAGKSTVLPIHLMDEPWLKGKKIILLEPRRLAARAVAYRLAQQLGEEPGQRVGYRIRFETRVSAQTQIEIVTEGILTRMLQEDNALEAAGLIIFDEFHERSLQADLALALSRESQQVLREDLRILIMSATLDGKELVKAFADAPLVRSEGRQYPVELRYAEPTDSDFLSKSTFQLIRKVLREEKEGDILVFLPGSADIKRVDSFLHESDTGVVVHQLFGDLPFPVQQKALQPDPQNRRKIILSTSIAETSVTIEGVRIVIDSGYSRLPRFDPRTGLTRLETVRVTKDTADQRAGRAGRTGPGISYRLWHPGQQQQLQDHRLPEIMEADLAQLLLELMAWGAKVENLSWITVPPQAGIAAAKKLLTELGAVEEDKLTQQGKALLEFPTHPRIAHLLLEGKRIKCPSLAADVAAVLEEKDPLSRDAGTDLFLRIQALNAWRRAEKVNADRNTLERIERLSKQWKKILKAESGVEAEDHFFIGDLVAAAYPERVSRKEGTSGRYRLANGRAARLPDADALIHEEWIAIAQMDAGMQEGKVFLAAALNPQDLINQLKPEEVTRWDEKAGQVQFRKEWRIGNLLAKEEPLLKPDPEKIAELIARQVFKSGLHVFEWTAVCRQLCARVESLNKWNPSLGFPDFSESGLLNSLHEWATPFLYLVRRLEDLKKLDLEKMLLSRLNWNQQQELNRLCPEKLEVPTGSHITLEYFADGTAPALAVRLQEVFGWSDTPVVNDGKTKVTLHLLSPGYKPVQVTQDLRSFWSSTYHEVRKELRVRYQKHSWPEDPWTAEAVRGAKKRKS